MLTINENGRVAGEEIHRVIESKTKDYSIWVKRKIEDADLVMGKDFSTILLESTGGRPKQQIEFTLQAAKEVCLLERNQKGKQIRRWLIELSDQKENLDLLTHDQVVMLAYLEGFFRYVENQKLVESKHKETFANNYTGSKNPYSEFHVWRNTILQIEPQKVDSALKNYCIENNKRYPKIKSKREKIQFLDEYDNLKNAVWDFLSIQGEVNAAKLASLVKRMAKAHNHQIYDKNETTLFQSKDRNPKFKEIRKRLL